MISTLVHCRSEIPHAHSRLWGSSLLRDAATSTARFGHGARVVGCIMDRPFFAYAAPKRHAPPSAFSPPPLDSTGASTMVSFLMPKPRSFLWLYRNANARGNYSVPASVLRRKRRDPRLVTRGCGWHGTPWRCCNVIVVWYHTYCYQLLKSL